MVDRRQPAPPLTRALLHSNHAIVTEGPPPRLAAVPLIKHSQHPPFRHLVEHLPSLQQPAKPDRCCRSTRRHGTSPPWTESQQDVCVCVQTCNLDLKKTTTCNLDEISLDKHLACIRFSCLLLSKLSGLGCKISPQRVIFFSKFHS